MLLQEPGQEHDRTNASQFWEFLIHPSDAPQLPPPEAAQSADLATDVQVTEAAGDGNSPGGALPLCWICSTSFKRSQELKRHLSQVHMPKRECPFGESCTHKWKRPAKIKDHIIEAHGSEFHPEVLQEIRKLRGKGVEKFLDV
jgi:hypothetical protein